MGFEVHELKRMYWHSRRGMLELDLILVPFAEQFLAQASDEDQQRYQLLLKEEDQDLYQWLIGRLPAPGPELQAIVDLVRAQTGHDKVF